MKTAATATIRGTITRIMFQDRRGLIRADDGREFDFKSTVHFRPGTLAWSNDLRGKRVEFSVTQTSKGPTAYDIRPIADTVS